MTVEPNQPAPPGRAEQPPAPGTGHRARRSPRRRAWQRRAAAVAALATGAGLLTLAPGGAPQAAAEGLVPWADCDAMLAHYRRELVRTATPYGVGEGGPVVALATRSGGGDRAGAPVPVADEAGSSARGGLSTGGAVGSGPTGTNLQVEGVDEPDVAKLAGGLVVTVVDGRLQVVRGGAAPALLSTLPLGADVGTAELLVDGPRVLVVATAWRPAPGGPAAESGLPPPLGPAAVGRIGSVAVDLPEASVLPAPGEPQVRLLLVDLTDPATPRTLESLELDGSAVSARLVDGDVRLVTRSSPRVAGTVPGLPGGPEQEAAALAANRRAAQAATLEQVLPAAVRRGADGTELDRSPAVPCTSVHTPVDAAAGASTLLVTTLRPADGLSPLHTTAVTTDGDLVAASVDRLHVATSRWGTVAPARPADDVAASDEVSTEIHAFDTSSPGTTRYVGSGSVPGYVYGRWALSQHEGHLRVATTTAAPWDGSGASSSSVVVLAEQGGRLVERGRLDGLGRTEQIYAVRYFGDLATVVTFRQTDPLHVLDLSDPTRPRRRGELEVPGFSTYLHPVGDDRLLGVGQDADAEGRVTGLQLSLFDVSDPSAPKQVDRLSLGEGWSPALDDSRAFGFDVGRRLAVLPFTSWSLQGGSAAALGVRVDGDRLVEAGRLTVGPEAGVERVLLDGDTAYAVTWRGVIAVDPASMRRTGSAAFGR